MAFEKKITAYQASDGKMFLTKRDAEEWEATALERRLENALYDHYSDDRAKLIMRALVDMRSSVQDGLRAAVIGFLSEAPAQTTQQTKEVQQ